MAKIAPASDPKWTDADFRTRTFKGAVSTHDLSLKQVAEITGRSYTTVRAWASGRSYTIPTAELRAFLYDIAEGRIEQ
jgi:hypothetical protein